MWNNSLHKDSKFEQERIRPYKGPTFKKESQGQGDGQLKGNLSRNHVCLYHPAGFSQDSQDLHMRIQTHPRK
jgi:hypothetical protein